MPRGTKYTGPTPHPLKENKIRVSSGRGGSGNIHSAIDLNSAALKDEAEVPHRRRMEKEEEEFLKYSKKQYTGRGGTGNIKAASMTQWISFDKSIDPDDSYEEIVVERNKSTPKPLRMGRGGSGNGLLKPAATNQITLGSGPSRLSLSSSNSSNSSFRLSGISFTSSSYSSPLGHRRGRSESSVFSRLPKFKQQYQSDNSDHASEISSEKVSQKSQWWKFERINTPTPGPSMSLNGRAPQLLVTNYDFIECLDENTMAILEAVERFEDEDKEVPELQPSCDYNPSDDTPDEEELIDESGSDAEDAEWERNVLIQAQYEVDSSYGFK